jgi:hypothetical protein
MVTARSPFVRPARLWLACGLSLALLGACSGDDDSASSSVPLPTSPSSAAASTTDSSSSSITTATPSPPTTVLNPPPSITNPTTSTATAASLPPVPTLVPQVPAELVQPEVLDPNNPNNSRPVLPEQVPVLEAYLRAIQAATLVSSTWPIDPSAPVLLGAPFTPEALARAQQGNQEALDSNEVLDVSQGVTFRPYVVGPVGETATVLDCELAGHYWKKADTGDLRPPDEIWPAGPGHIVEVGLRVHLVLRDGQWLWDSSQIDPAACA